MVTLSPFLGKLTPSPLAMMVFLTSDIAVGVVLNLLVARGLLSANGRNERASVAAGSIWMCLCDSFVACTLARSILQHRAPPF